MFSDNNEVLSYLKANHIGQVDLKFTDLFGAWHHITLPANAVSLTTFSEGVGFDGSSIPGFKTVESGDLVLVPDPKTGFLDPFWEIPTLSFICNIAEADTKQPFDRDPRRIAQKAEEYLRQSGIATESKWGPEFEYYVFEQVDFRNEPFYSYFKVESEEAIWCNYSNGGRRSGYQIADHHGYHAIPPQDTLYNIRAATVKALEECGIPVRYHHHEVGASGQIEIEVLMGPLTRMGDVVMLTKYIAKMVARRYGKTATFMPKPLYKEAGSGMHFHQHLFKAGEPLFYDANGYGGLSKMALAYIAGLLKHAPALTGLTNPSTNSYRRLVPGYEAPVNLFFSLANRSSAVRIPKYANTPSEKRIELRTPDATCNPYLAMAAMLLAGIDGIQQNLDITREGFGPYDVNLFDPANAAIRKEIKSVPDSLDKALEMLLADHAFLVKSGVFPTDLFTIWAKEKYEKEYLENRNRPTPFEFQLYYGI